VQAGGDIFEIFAARARWDEIRRATLISISLAK
jgi:hypothetical protein